MNAQEETSGTTRMQQRHMGLRPKRAATFRNQEGIQQDHQADFQAGDREAHRRVFCEDSKNAR
jgi:hypothetical protein